MTSRPSRPASGRIALIVMLVTLVGALVALVGAGGRSSAVVIALVGGQLLLLVALGIAIAPALRASRGPRR